MVPAGSYTVTYSVVDTTTGATAAGTYSIQLAHENCGGGVSTTGHLVTADTNGFTPTQVKAPATAGELAYTGPGAEIFTAQWGLMLLALGFLIMSSPILRGRRFGRK